MVGLAGTAPGDCGAISGRPVSSDAVPASAIAIRGAVKRYGEITAVDGLDLEVPAGVCFGLAQFNPLYHCVQLVRDASIGGLHAGDLGHAGVLLLLAVLMWRLAIWRLGKWLID